MTFKTGSQSTLRLKYSSTNEHSPHRYGSPKKGFYRLRPIALALKGSIMEMDIYSYCVINSLPALGALPL